jgi:hypothetical protein
MGIRGSLRCTFVDHVPTPRPGGVARPSVKASYAGRPDRTRTDLLSATPDPRVTI